MISAIPSPLWDAYAVFRRPRRAADGLTAGQIRAMPAFGDPSLGLNPELSRLVTAADGTRAHLVPGDDVLAVVEPGGGGSVIGLGQALAGTGIGTSLRGPGRLMIVGLVPDAVDRITVVRRNGEEAGIDVREHLYAADVRAGTADELPAEVRFDLSGERRLPVPGADEAILAMRPGPGEA